MINDSESINIIMKSNLELDINSNYNIELKSGKNADSINTFIKSVEKNISNPATNTAKGFFNDYYATHLERVLDTVYSAIKERNAELTSAMGDYNLIGPNYDQPDNYYLASLIYIRNSFRENRYYNKNMEFAVCTLTIRNIPYYIFISYNKRLDLLYSLYIIGGINKSREGSRINIRMIPLYSYGINYRNINYVRDRIDMMFLANSYRTWTRR